MDDGQREQISRALHDGLYALLGLYEVSEMDAADSLRGAIHLVNDEWGIDTGNRTEEGLDAFFGDEGSQEREEDEDPKSPATYHKDFHDEQTGTTWAAITETELVVLGGHGLRLSDPPLRYPLGNIEAVKELQAPWGDTQVEAEIPGPETNPCLKFTAHVLSDCADS